MIEWEQYSQTPPTEDEIRKWWTKWPTANIGLITGRVSGVVVVDIDTKKGADPNSVYDKRPTNLIARTGSNGFHLFYDYPGGVSRVPNRVNAGGIKGVDVRGDGGIIILPPSIHETGRRYAFVREGDPGHDFPDWLLHSSEDSGEAPDDDHRWISDTLKGVESGGRNDACARLSGYFVKKGMAGEIALTLVQQWNERNIPPLSPSEVETTFRSVQRAHARNNPKPTREQILAQQTTGRKAGEFRVIHFQDYMAEYGDVSVDWDVDGWLPARTIAFAISPPGSFKTWTILDLAISIASGEPFLGKYPTNSSGPVLLIQQEDYHGQIAERLATIVRARYEFPDIPPTYASEEDDPSLPSSASRVPERHLRAVQNLPDTPHDEEFSTSVPPELPIFVHPDRAFRFDDPLIVSSLRQQIAKIRPKLVILDPLYSAGGTEDYMAKTAEQAFVFKRMRDEFGCSFLIVHHTKKGAEGSQREGLWGSQFLNAFLETGWQMRPGEDPNSVTVRRHFKIGANAPDVKLGFDISTVPPYRYAVTTEEGVFDQTNLVAFLEQHGPMTVSEIAEKMKAHRTTVTRKAAPLIKKGLIGKDDENRLFVADLPDFT